MAFGSWGMMAFWYDGGGVLLNLKKTKQNLTGHLTSKQKNCEKELEFSDTTKIFLYILFSGLGCHLFSLVGFHLVAKTLSCGVYFMSISFHFWSNKQIFFFARHRLALLSIRPFRLRSFSLRYLSKRLPTKEQMLLLSPFRISLCRK